jgi:hypothetical protein
MNLQKNIKTPGRYDNYSEIKGMNFEMVYKSEQIIPKNGKIRQKQDEFILLSIIVRVSSH